MVVAEPELRASTSARRRMALRLVTLRSDCSPQCAAQRGGAQAIPARTTADTPRAAAQRRITTACARPLSTAPLAHALPSRERTVCHPTHLLPCTPRISSTSSPPSMALFFSDPLEVAVSSCSLALACLSCVWLLLLHHHRYSPLIKAHSYAFLSLSLFGSLLASLAVFTWPLDSSSALCLARPWAFTLPLYILLCPLLAKHYRIHRIFNSAQLTATRWGVSDLHVSLLSLGLILPQLALDIAWTVTAPLTLTAPIPLPDGSSIHDCHASTASAAFAWASVAYLGLLLASAGYLTVRLRHLSDTFNQSKDILSCTLLIVGAAAVIIALQVTSETDYKYRYSIRSFGLMGIIIAWQLVIMVPKLRGIAREAAEGGGEGEGVSMGGKGIARLPLSPHTMKQIASLQPSQRRAGEGAKGKDGSSLQLTPARGKGHYHPALSPLMTFVAPSDVPATSTAEVDVVVEGGAAEVHSSSRVSVTNPLAHLQSEVASVSSAGMKGGVRSGGAHLRSKSAVPARGGLEKGGVGGVGERLLSWKAIKAGQVNSSSETGGGVGGGGVGKVTVKGGRGKAGEWAGALMFKPNFEEHLSPLYTPAAITVEPVPVFMQE